MKKPKLTLNNVVAVLFNIRSNWDRRRKVNLAIVSYSGSNGFEYRKSFEFPVKVTRQFIENNVPVSL